MKTFLDSIGLSSYTEKIKNYINTKTNQNQTDLTTHINNADIHVTTSKKTEWDAATNKINNLEVGGTNLLTGTRDFTGGWSWVGNEPIQDDDSFKCFRLIGSFSNFVRHYITLKQDDYILSFYAKSDKTEAICIKDDLTNAEVGYVTIDDSEWKKYSIGIPRTLVITDISFLTRQNDTPIYIKKIKLEKGNVATDWTPAPEDKIEIADVNGLQDITNNNQYTKAHLTSQGWYRIAKYKGSNTNEVRGVFGNSCDIIIKRMFMNNSTEEHRLLLKSRFQVQKFVSISNFSYEGNIINKIRYVYDSTSAYIDIYYNAASENATAFMINNGRDFSTIYWETVTPYLVAETTDGEAVSTVFDIPANADPVNSLDIVNFASKSIYGDNSISINRKTDSIIGENSVAIGINTLDATNGDVTASGKCSFAHGTGYSYKQYNGSTFVYTDYYITASGDYSHAEGIGTTASGQGSHSEGLITTASGDYSHAEGYGAKAISRASHAEGTNTTASGDYSHAEGFKTTASGGRTHAEGQNTTASGQYSHAEGYGAKAISRASHAEGETTTASGDYSHAEGLVTTASGYCSHAEGIGTTALKNQHAQGHYNNTATALENSEEGTSSGTAFVIGNGTSSSKSNAFRVTGQGNVYATNATISTGADYAEYFEWSDSNPNNEDRVGYFVTLDENNPKKIRIANEGDYILGIVSGMPSVIGNGDECWKQRYILDEFGRYIEEEFEYEEEIHKGEDEEGNPIIETVTKTGTKYKENPDYDASKEYIQRKERAEWDAVGMLGVLSVYDDGTCKVNSYCKCGDNGIAIATTERGYETYRVINRVSDNIIEVIFK